MSDADALAARRIRIHCLSGTGQSWQVAECLAGKLGGGLNVEPIRSKSSGEGGDIGSGGEPSRGSGDGRTGGSVPPSPSGIQCGSNNPRDSKDSCDSCDSSEFKDSENSESSCDSCDSSDSRNPSDSESSCNSSDSSDSETFSDSEESRDSETPNDSNVSAPAGALVVFPVHCQGVPRPVMEFLRALKAPFVALVATYGRISHGDALNDAARAVRCPVVAAAYVPARHSYAPDDRFEITPGELDALDPLVGKIADASASPSAPLDSISIPRDFANPLAKVLPVWRSQVAVRLSRSSQCDGCGACVAQCPAGALTGEIVKGNGAPLPTCLRCLKCAAVCPRGAIRWRLSPPLKWYLDHYLKRDGARNVKAQVFCRQCH